LKNDASGKITPGVFSMRDEGENTPGVIFPLASFFR
jgi:hypothetical protein